MAYEPKTWVCGETITADGLNNIEEGIQDALECCEDKGFECSEELTMLTEETVTTVSFGAPFSMGEFAYSTLIDAEEIRVTLDGETYLADRIYQDSPECYVYYLGTIGNISSYTQSQPTNMLMMNGSDSAGEHSVKIESNVEVVTTSECFEKAVNKVAPPLKYVKDADIFGGVLANDVNGNTATAQYAFAEGSHTTASGNSSHAEGSQTVASGASSHSEGDYTTASGGASHAEGYATVASGADSHAEGNTTTASGDYSHAEGSATKAIGDYSHAEGNTTEARDYSHAEGRFSKATGDCSHAEGNTTTASGEHSHAEGDTTTASGNSSHAEGYYTNATGTSSHAEGHGTTASGMYSHAEGANTTASGMYSHAQNSYVIARGYAQTAIGEYNAVQGNANSRATTDYAFIIGNGTADNARSNALAIKWDGTFVFANGTEITPAQFASLLALL